MNVNINISTALYQRLEKHVRGFGDTPTRVIERLLNHYEATKEPTLEETEEPGRKDKARRPKDTTKYFFKDRLYGKSRLVMAVVRDYVESNPDVTFEKLKKEIFPDHLQGSIGVVNHVGYVNRRYKNKTDKRHFVMGNETIQIADETVAVCTQWGIKNIYQFIEKARAHGFEIKELQE